MDSSQSDAPAERFHDLGADPLSDKQRAEGHDGLVRAVLASSEDDRAPEVKQRNINLLRRVRAGLRRHDATLSSEAPTPGQ
jgi:hypothetical protein